MNPEISRKRDRLLSKMLGINVRDSVNGLQQSLTRVEDAINAIERDVRPDTVRMAAIDDKLDFLYRRLVVDRERLRIERDDIDGLRSRLAELRESSGYAGVFDEPEPLVTIRIPAYRKTEELLDVAIASVRRQTYQRFEIVIVNDGPNQATSDALTALADDRIRYYEFPEQSRYPLDSQSRWMVAGSPGMNRAVELARGSWIAPLDDDDEFSADHLEKLLGAATAARAELAYGALTQRHLTHGTERRVWSSPPEAGEFSMMASMYLKSLDFFRYDVQSWMIDEPGDWNLIRRMTEAGVRMTAIDDIVGTINMVPYTAKDRT